MTTGDYVQVDFVRSEILTESNGWFAHDVIVQVEQVFSVTFTFHFNGIKHWSGIDDAKPIKSVDSELSDQQDKIVYKETIMKKENALIKWLE